MLTFIPEEDSNRKSSQEKPARYYTDRQGLWQCKKP
jgi:hypothetical protein